MNDSELNELLQRALVPERSANEWKEFAGVTMRFVAASRESAAGHAGERLAALSRDAATKKRRFATWAVGFAAACVLAGFIIGQRQGPRGEQRNEIAEARKLFTELNALFPNQLQAVIFDGLTPRLVLTERPAGNQGTPLFVRICDAQGCHRVITFSGERVAMNGENCEVLLDARGHIIIAGERFVWSSADRRKSGGYRVEGALLPGVL